MAKNIDSALLKILIWVGLVVLVGIGVYIFWPRPAAQSFAPIPIPISIPLTATPAPVLSTPTPIAVSQPTLSIETSFQHPTPSANGVNKILAPIPDAVGWATSLDGRIHYDVPNIHAGILKENIYYGALQFDLSDIPPGATVAYAALELTGLDEQYLGTDGVWQLHLLDPVIDSDWPDLTYQLLHDAAIETTLLSTLAPTDLSQNKINIFPFDEVARSGLQQQLSKGVVSFRLDGPTSGLDNLFTWRSGSRGKEILETSPALHLVIIPPLVPEYVIVTSTPTPENIITAAAMAATATEIARTTGTFTPIPEAWVTPWVIVSTPLPENTATALYQQAEATAQAFLFGSATPTPPNVWTATPTAISVDDEITSSTGETGGIVSTPSTPTTTPTPTPTTTPTPLYTLLDGELATPWATPTPTATPQPIPAELVGKIAFLSNRSGGPEPLSQPLVYIMDADGSNLAVLTDRTNYDTAVSRDVYSADQRFRAFIKDTVRFDDAKVPGLHFYDYLYNAEHQITHFGAGAAWDPVWSPTQEQIAFISNDSYDDEIWVVDYDGGNLQQLTASNEAFNAREIGKDTFIPEVNGQPSWSPDGARIIFWSNRTGNRQIWIMDADGSNLRSLSTTNYDDWNPVWIKYIDPARDPSPQ